MLQESDEKRDQLIVLKPRTFIINEWKEMNQLLTTAQGSEHFTDRTSIVEACILHENNSLISALYKTIRHNSEYC